MKSSDLTSGLVEVEVEVEVEDRQSIGHQVPVLGDELALCCFAALLLCFGGRVGQKAIAKAGGVWGMVMVLGALALALAL